MVIALLLALLALLARGATPRRAAAGGVLVGLALLVRSSFVPMLALGGLACLLGHGSRVRRLLLFAAGASIALAGLLLGEGQAYQPYLPRTTVAAGWFPDVFVSELWTLAAAAFLGACAWWRAVRDGRPIVPDRARYGCVLVIAWIAGWWVFLLAATRLVVMSSYVLDDRMLAPAAAVTSIASALLVWRICPERLRPLRGGCRLRRNNGAGDRRRRDRARRQRHGPTPIRVLRQGSCRAKHEGADPAGGWRPIALRLPDC